VKTLFAKEKRPVSQSRLVNFLSARVPANRVLDLIGIMVRGDLIDELPQANGLRFYTPHKEEPQC
jgi:hypothetical protein